MTLLLITTSYHSAVAAAIFASTCSPLVVGVHFGGRPGPVSA